MAPLLTTLLILSLDADRLIRDLGAEEIATREAASTVLLALGRQRADPVLDRALAHRDPEVRARAGAVHRIFHPPVPPSRVDLWGTGDPLDGDGAIFNY